MLYHLVSLRDRLKNWINLLEDNMAARTYFDLCLVDLRGADEGEVSTSPQLGEPRTPTNGSHT